MQASKTKFEVSFLWKDIWLAFFITGYINLDSWNGWYNDQNDGIEWPLSTFVGDTKLGGVADILEGRAATQTDLVRLEKWALGDLMKFSKGKCKALQVGWHNPPGGQAGIWLGREQLCRKGAEGCDGQAECEPTVCSWSSCAQLQTGLSTTEKFGGNWFFPSVWQHMWSSVSHFKKATDTLKQGYQTAQAAAVHDIQEDESWICSGLKKMVSGDHCAVKHFVMQGCRRNAATFVPEVLKKQWAQPTAIQYRKQFWGFF